MVIFLSKDFISSASSGAMDRNTFGTREGIASPHTLSRGNLCFSRTAIFNPEFFLNARAQAVPAGPAPTMMISKMFEEEMFKFQVSSFKCFKNFGAEL